MHLVVNGDPRDVPDGTDIAGLVLELGLVPDGIAVAVDHAVVPRSRWSGTALTDGAQVEIVTAMQGG